jgi:hypothetical protein
MNGKSFVVPVVAAACAAAIVSSSVARTTADLPTSNLNTHAGRLTSLHSGVSYQASAFPLALRITPPDETWGGAQWTTSSHGHPAFGWAAFGQGPTNKPPRGVLEIETAYATTPTVASILARLRTAGGGATFGATTRVRLAGFPAWQIDGRVYGKFGHVFVPFTPKTGGASPPDNYKLSPGEAFRLDVLDARGKRIVVIFDSDALPADQFPTFLDSAGKLLRSLKLG